MAALRRDGCTRRSIGALNGRWTLPSRLTALPKAPVYTVCRQSRWWNAHSGILIALRIPSVGEAKRQCSCQANESTSAAWCKVKLPMYARGNYFWGKARCTVRAGVHQAARGWPDAWIPALSLSSGHRRSQLPRALTAGAPTLLLSRFPLSAFLACILAHPRLRAPTRLQELLVELHRHHARRS